MTTSSGEPAPPRVKEQYDYWTSPPPEITARCMWWINKINDGWRPNGRIKRLGYGPATEHFGVYVWEYLNLLYPLMRAKR